MSKVYICEGDCFIEVTKEEYENGTTTCYVKHCISYGKPLLEVDPCQCGANCCKTQNQI